MKARQIVLEISTEKIIAANDSVRVLEEMLDAIKIQSATGTHKIPIKTMLKIIVYGYTEGMNSLRKIEKACKRDINFRWLLQDNPIPSKTTNGRFIQENNDLIEKLFYQVVEKLYDTGEIQGKNVYIDGSSLVNLRLINEDRFDELTKLAKKELVGKAFTWNYSSGTKEISSLHVYSSPWGSSWTIYMPNQEGGIVWSSPCSYIKLREDAYVLTWVEETSAGGQGTVLINLRAMHDGGFIYGDLLNDKRAALAIIGAYGRNAGQLDILKYYEPKVK